MEEIARGTPHVQQEFLLSILTVATLQDAWFARYGVRWTSEEKGFYDQVFK
jgi:hypothetical protein